MTFRLTSALSAILLLTSFEAGPIIEFGDSCGRCDKPSITKRLLSCLQSEPRAPQEQEKIGTWHWSRSPNQEKRVVLSLYNRYCVRCHGVDGKGIWDIPDVPDFTNPRWQSGRSDAQIVRLTLEGRGACMPAFQGTLSIEEAWAMARYLRTFLGDMHEHSVGQ